MTSRERILTAIARQVPPRVPRSFDMIMTDDRKREILEHLGGQDPHEYFSNDLRYSLRATLVPDETQDELRSRFAAYGRDYYPAHAQLDCLGAANLAGSSYHFYREIPAPCARFTSLDEFRDYPFPVLEDDAEKHKQLSEKATEIKAKGFVSRCEAWHILSCLRQLRGFEGFLTDFQLHPDIAEFLLHWCTDAACKDAEMYARSGVDIYRLGDDLGAQTSLLVSPTVFRQFIKPCFARMISTVRKTNPDVIIAMHSDGNIASVIPDLIEIGVQLLNPIQPECMDPAEIKKKYGDALSFWGSIGTQFTLPFGSEKDVRDEVKLRMDTIGKGGGFIIGPSHVIEPEVPWRNIAAMFEAIDDFGTY